MAGTAAKTIVTIKGPNGDFHGQDQEPGCRMSRRPRRPALHVRQRDGPFERTGNSDTSQQQGDVGEWSLGNTGLRDGFFYAKAKATPACKGGKSRVLELVNGVPQ